MRIEKTLVETHEFPNGEIQAVLYDNDDKVVRVVKIGKDGMPILSEEERKALGDELKKFNTDDPVKAHRSAVESQQDEYQPIEKVGAMLNKMSDEEMDELVKRVVDEVSGKYIQRNVRKGFISNLIGLGAIASMLPNREQDRLNRLARDEMKRAEKIREINNKRLRGRR